jgi:hypothetical protein
LSVDYIMKNVAGSTLVAQKCRSTYSMKNKGEFTQM